MKRFIILFLFGISFCLVAEVTTSENILEFKGNSYEITRVEKAPDGANDSSFTWDFYLLTGDLNTRGANGKGQKLFLDVNTPSESSYDGNYTKLPNRDPYSVTIGSVYTNMSGGQYAYEYIIKTGTLKILTDGDIFTLEFSFVSFDGTIIKGKYKGPVHTM